MSTVPIVASTKPDPKIYCNDGCKRGMLPTEIESSGWQLLQITQRYRCVDCCRELREANERHGNGNR